MLTICVTLMSPGELVSLFHLDVTYMSRTTFHLTCLMHTRPLQRDISWHAYDIHVLPMSWLLYILMASKDIKYG